ncbi:hypothetical protein E3T46_07735 [Cryobacterium sp. Hh11]|nr:hypothetical protein E3T46_07735 [Cryobacterium sp. Hh11]
MNGTPDPARVFTLTGERSDCCPSRAYATATVDGVALLFCSHHWRQHRGVLTEITCDWLDETDAVLLKTGSVTEV